MKLNSTLIKSLFIIFLIGGKINEKNLIKKTILSEKDIATLLSEGYIGKLKNKYGVWLYISGFNPTIKAFENLISTLSYFKL